MKRTFKKMLTMLLICCMVATVAAVSSTTEVEAASFTYNQNVSSSKVTKSSTSGSMPTAVSSLTGGKSYYFNLQTSDKYYITSAALYVKLPGDSDYTKVYTKTSSSGVHYVAKSYTINNTKGTYYYYWKIDYKTSSSSSKKTTYSTSKKSLTVSAKTTISSTYNSSLNSFLSKSKFKNGASWSSSKTCQVSPYGTKASGCCAYVADLVYTLYGAKTPSSGTSFTSVSSIRAGDVLKMKSSSGTTHWIYVYGRSGNTLYTVAGNESSKVCVSTSKYTISGSKIKTSSTTYTLTKGYHYEP